MEHKKVIEKFVMCLMIYLRFILSTKSLTSLFLHMYILQAIKDWWWEWPWNEASIIVSSCFVGWLIMPVGKQSILPLLDMKNVWYSWRTQT